MPFERGNYYLRDEMFVDKRKNIIFLKPIPLIIFIDNNFFYLFELSSGRQWQRTASRYWWADDSDQTFSVTKTAVGSDQTISENENSCYLRPNYF